MLLDRKRKSVARLLAVDVKPKKVETIQSGYVCHYWRTTLIYSVR